MPQIMLGGWHKDKFDSKDYLKMAKAGPVPDADLSYLKPKHRRQLASDCVGFAMGANLCAVLKRLGIYEEWVSPTWIYNGARFIEGSLLLDNGCYPKDALEWLRLQGVLLERYWSYNGFDTTAPGSTVAKHTSRYPGFVYDRVVDGVAGILSALADGHMVSIGTPWFRKWENPERGILPIVTDADEVIGGHETVLYKSMQESAIIKGMNSWWDEDDYGMWGDFGDYYMPFSAFNVFKQFGGYDAHIVTFNKPEIKKQCWLSKFGQPRELN